MGGQQNTGLAGEKREAPAQSACPTFGQKYLTKRKGRMILAPAIHTNIK
jgi:hypothetical protein